MAITNIQFIKMFRTFISRQFIFIGHKLIKFQLLQDLYQKFYQRSGKHVQTNVILFVCFQLSGFYERTLQLMLKEIKYCKANYTGAFG